MLKTVAHNLRQLLVVFDQFLNVAVCSIVLPGERSWADETFSSRCWRWDASGKRHWPRKLVDGIMFFDRNHCRESFLSERLQRQMPPEARVEDSRPRRRLPWDCAAVASMQGKKAKSKWRCGGCRVLMRVKWRDRTHVSRAHGR